MGGGAVGRGLGGLEPFSTLALIRLEPGGGRADGHPGRVARFCVRPVGVLQGSWVVTDQPNPQRWWFPLCLQPPSPNQPVSYKLSIELAFSPHHLFWATEWSGSEICF